MKTQITFNEVFDLPENPNLKQGYRLLPKLGQEDDYWLMIDRLFPFVTREEIIDFFQKWTVTILGTGGMGGWMFLALVRLGIIRFRIADPDIVDATNKGRQAVANNTTIGKNKAIEIARMAREIYSGNYIDVYPMGANPDSIESLVKGSTIVFNEVEFWAIGSRMLVDIYARKYNALSITCPTVGHTTYVFVSDKNSPTLEEFWDISLDEAMHLQNKIQSGFATQSEKDYVMNLMFRAYVPFGFTEHSLDPMKYSIKDRANKRMQEGSAPIFGINAMLSAADVAQRVIIHLLNRFSDIKRELVFPDVFPAGEYFNYLTRETIAIPKNR